MSGIRPPVDDDCRVSPEQCRLGMAVGATVQRWLPGTAHRFRLAMGVAPFATFLFCSILALEKPFGILTHTALLEMSALIAR